MSRPIKISWPLASTTAVCLAQQPAGAGAFIINGSSSTSGVATFVNLERSVSITTAGNVSGTQFTITGTLRGKVVSETRVGPNVGVAATVYTAQRFTEVTSVTVNNAPAAAASIGSGLTGATIWLQSDYHRANNALAVYADILGNVVSYTFQATFDNVSTVANPRIIAPIDGGAIPTIPANTDMITQGINVLANYTIPTNFFRIEVDQSNATGTATFYFLQQGIK